jgi:GNAT superfamily N-acetyltransferase
MKITKSNHINASQLFFAYQIWNAEYPGEIRYQNLQEFANYFSALENIQYYIACNEDDIFCGLAFVFIREKERWFAVMIDTNYQNIGIGKQLLLAMQQHEKLLNAWVVFENKYLKQNGKPYLPPIEFYRKYKFIVKKNSTKIIGNLQVVKMVWKE